jgi:hypothetical protein
MLTNNTDAEKLVGKVFRLAEQIAGYTEKLVVSLASLDEHKNVKRKLEKAGIRDFTNDEIKFVAGKLRELCQRFNINVVACREEGFAQYGIGTTKCIDDGLMRRAFSDDVKLMAFLGDGTGLKNKGQVKACGCITSKDIGHFNSCQNFCVYCYANASERVVNKNIEKAGGGNFFMIPDQMKTQ